ncbi:MAG: porin family protein [Hyphomicrobiaceae bacterium]|nr:MAG: porin family protein [Hyphomicrobiaceae bacterium]
MTTSNASKYAFAGLVALSALLPMSASAASLKDDFAPPVYKWSGLYIGGHAGLATGDTTGNADLGFFSVSTDYEISGAIYGGYIGYNHQTGNLVLGIEGTLSGASIKGDTTCLIALKCAREVDWMATLVGRLGYAMDRTMVYGVIGVAWADVETKVTDNIFGGALLTLNGDKNHTGFVIGFGIEHALSHNIVARIEYNHIDFRSETHDLSITFFGVPVPATIPSRVDLDVDTIKIGVAVKF